MKNIRKVAILTMIIPMMAALVGCDDTFDPAVENHKDKEQLTDMPQWAVGLLGHAYISNPLGQTAGQWWKWTEVATDDAVSNDVNNTYLRMASGTWRSDNNPMDNWRYLRGSWQYINQFIELAPTVTWANDAVAAELYKQRFLGEGYGMRALYMYHLLMAHAGWSADGQLLGIPILTESETVNSDFNLPRNTFKECIDQLNSDVELAIKYLPEDYGNISDNSAVPAKYREAGATAVTYTRVFGDHSKNRMSARIAKAVRAQAALLAASPAYNQGSGVTWEEAANRMAEVLKGLGSNPIAMLDPNGNKWYTDYKSMKEWEAGYNPLEVLWRSNKDGDKADSDECIEKQNFPPSLYGNGRVNPSQNLVDAFPMADGTPISESANYDPQNPYANRDPRLALYIVYNGSQVSGKTIDTSLDGTTDDALNRYDGRSTRTGYYLRKLLVEDVICNPNNATGQTHIKPWMRYTEFFLGYAEAANEAWGPTGSGSNGFSAYDVIKAIRQRAGIDAADPYLEKCKTSKDQMRELIRNERRIELCFEGFRFWDLRRWKVDLSKLNETVKGIRISKNHYEVINVEERKYQDYMYYGPIPYSEILKFSELTQNKGW